MGSRIKPVWLIVLANAGVAMAIGTRGDDGIDWTRMIGFPLVLIEGYLLLSIGNAQIRARAQPFYHTLVLRDDHIEVSDRLRRTSDRYPWADFERVEIAPGNFTIRRRGAPRGEEYVIDRGKLTAAEERFLGERMVEL